jgi:hypothetical protein
MGSAVPRPPGAPVVRRVRHGVRDGLAVMAFSATMSAAVALLLLVLARLTVSAGS